MKIFTPIQLLHPGVIHYDDERRKLKARYEGAVKRAGFLSEREKRNWLLLSYMLTAEQLKMGEQLIIDEDMRRLQMRQQLEKIKPKKEKRHGR